MNLSVCIITKNEKENLEKVLDKFFQEDYNKAGSGLGLAISNEIVKLHKGKLILESKKGEGTCITFTLKNKLILAMRLIAEGKFTLRYIKNEGKYFKYKLIQFSNTRQIYDKSCKQ